MNSLKRGKTLKDQILGSQPPKGEIFKTQDGVEGLVRPAFQPESPTAPATAPRCLAWVMQIKVTLK